MKLSHDLLCQLGELLGYSSLEGGICQGFTGMLIQAILAEDEQSFYERLNFIVQYQSITQLAHEIKTIRRKIREHGCYYLNEKEWQLLEVPAFF